MSEADILRELKRLEQRIDLLSSRDVPGSRGWHRSPYAWTRNSNTQFQIATIDDTARYPLGTRLWWKEAAVSRYGSVVSSSFGANTLVNIIGDVMAVSPDAREQYYSYSAAPQGMTNNWGVILYDSLLGAAAASFDIQNIPATFRHLRIEFAGRGDNNSNSIQLRMRFNNDGGARYDYQNLLSYNLAPNYTTQTGLLATAIVLGWDIPALTTLANYFGQYTISIPGYTDTGHFRGGHCEGGLMIGNPITNAYVSASYFGWRNSANAIDRITVYPAVGNFIAGTRLTLYGV